ncbi:MAG: SMC-Scp complex subunit ScpB [Candidatus Omnitrophica bacterium]|nr:SMC-Scp complex subunit ScpB [Candidatus Omnitrophota bacterium]
MTKEEAKRIIEAILFSSNKPVVLNELAAALEESDTAAVKGMVGELESEYRSQNRSFGVIEIAGGFQLAADTYYAPWIKKLLTKEKQQRLSMPTLETLAIIAYKQPITRSEIETIRGVNIDGIIENLLEKGMIRTSGRREAPGRPFVYSVTDDFLSHFGIMSLGDLPKLKEFTEADIQAGENDMVIKKENAKDGIGEPTKTD